MNFMPGVVSEGAFFFHTVMAMTHRAARTVCTTIPREFCVVKLIQPPVKAALTVTGRVPNALQHLTCRMELNALTG